MNEDILRDYLIELDGRIHKMAEDQRAVTADRLDRWSLLLLEMAIRLRCGGLLRPNSRAEIAEYCDLAARLESGDCPYPYDPELM